jgi:DNA-binding response OmpR family regulator
LWTDYCYNKIPAKLTAGYFMKTILVIEDEVDITEIITIVLEDEGYKVRSLSNADHYEARLKESYPDLVLLDLNIGGFNGQIICEYIKSHFDLKSIPVILVSANINAVKVKEECGAEDLLEKPFDITSLVSKVQALAA